MSTVLISTLLYVLDACQRYASKLLLMLLALYAGTMCWVVLNCIFVLIPLLEDIWRNEQLFHQNGPGDQPMRLTSASQVEIVLGTSPRQWTRPAM